MSGYELGPRRHFHLRHRVDRRAIALPAKRATHRGRLGTGDQGALDRAMDVARRLEQRVESLERVLDEDAPGWRARVRA